MRGNFRKREEGQAVVEFALVLIILIMLLCAPIDLFRYINMRTMLCSAASESLTRVTYASVEGDSLEQDVRGIMTQTYGDRIDMNTVRVMTRRNGDVTREDYSYYVYSSALANPNPMQYWSQFEKRPANYSWADIELQLAADFRPITFWGVMLLGDNVTVETPTYHMAVYAGGYVGTP